MKQITIVLILMLFATIEVTAKTFQTAYRWRNDDGSEATATWKAPENVPIYFEGNDVVRLRVQENYFEPDDIVFPTEEDIEISQYDFNEEISLFYSSQASGIWVKITNDATSNAFALYNSVNVTDLEPTTQQFAENVSYIWQPGVLFTSTSNHNQVIPSEYYTEFEWSIQPTANAIPGVYYFVKGWDTGSNEVFLLKDNGSYAVSTVYQMATMYYEVPMPAIPLRNWAIYSSLILIIGFMGYRFWR